MKNILIVILTFYTFGSINAQHLIQKIVASDRSTGGKFGSSIGVYENYAVVGAIIEPNDDLGGNYLGSAGAAYIFEKDSIGNWQEVQKIVPSDRNQFDEFGNSVAIYGNFIVIGGS